MGNELLEMQPAAFLQAAATASGGLTDFGDPSFLEPLGVLIEAVEREGQLTRAGLFGWQQRTLQLLTHRLRMQELFRQHPEILTAPVTRPLVIVSLQRTGSTKLQAVLACDERRQAPCLWEALFPVPFPGELPGDPRPRIEAAKAWEKMFYGAIPEALAAHAMFAEATEEETFAVEMSFRWTVASVSARIPSYIRWVENHDATPTYRDMKRILQAWQWQRGSGKPWVLKSPWHIGFLDALLEVFPDATIVQCHRDPYESVPSTCALMHLGRRVGRPTLSKIEHGAEVLAMNGREMTQHLRQRAALGAKDPTVDVFYQDIVHDVIGVARRIYATRGESLTPDAERRMRQWELDNGQHKHGKFHYTAEEYGITREGVAAAFADYYAHKEWFARLSQRR